MKQIECGNTPTTKTRYYLYENGDSYLVELYSPLLPKNAPFVFFGSLEKCKEFIALR